MPVESFDELIAAVYFTALSLKTCRTNACAIFARPQVQAYNILAGVVLTGCVGNERAYRYYGKDCKEYVANLHCLDFSKR